MYYVIYDGNCNLCVNLVKILESLDRGERFLYTPMQDQNTLTQFGITADDCELGMILIDATDPTRCWQGSNAAEEIGRLLPVGSVFVDAYRALPGMKWLGDRVYERVRDNLRMSARNLPAEHRKSCKAPLSGKRHPGRCPTHNCRVARYAVPPQAVCLASRFPPGRASGLLYQAQPPACEQACLSRHIGLVP